MADDVCNTHVCCVFRGRMRLWGLHFELHRGDGGRFLPEVQGLFGGGGGKRRVGGSQYVVKLLLIRLY